MNYIVGEKYDGMIYTGEHSKSEIFNGQPLPLFTTPKETAESWNTKARAMFHRYYVQEHGREPENFEAEFAEYNRKIYLMIGRAI